MKRLDAMRLYGAALGLGCLASSVSLAQVSADLARCTQVADDKSRLKCYDEQMTRAGHPVAASSAESSPPPAEPAELTGRVKSVSTRAHGEYSIEMDNGQIWVETLRTGGQPPCTTPLINSGPVGWRGYVRPYVQVH